MTDNQASEEALEMAKELDTISERLEEIGEIWAVEMGFRAVEHKIGEALGPLYNAIGAARQYASGVLKPVDD